VLKEKLLAGVLIFRCMFKHTLSGGNLVKTIKIRGDVYEKLTVVKGEDESFSELLDRLVERVYSIKTLRRLRGTIELKSGEREKLLAEVRARRAERGYDRS
jgi:predicted CopG family antitoxin